MIILFIPEPRCSRTDFRLRQFVLPPSSDTTNFSEKVSFLLLLASTNRHTLVAVSPFPQYSTHPSMVKKYVDEDSVRRKALLEEKRAARKAATNKEPKNAPNDHTPTTPTNTSTSNQETNALPCALLSLPQDTLHHVFTCLSAQEFGRLVLTSHSLHRLLNSKARVSVLLSRLPMIACPDDARALLQQLEYAGGDTGRLSSTNNDFLSYARFVESASVGYSPLVRRTNKNDPILLPTFLQGAVASVSPKHSLFRVDNGVASWGVGKRGQLGHGTREDERIPRRLLGAE
jgi:hypothetical protein